MNSFVFYNPTRVICGKGAMARLSEHVPATAKVLLLFGSGSIKRNGVYEKVATGVGNRIVLEEGGIQPNPSHEQCDPIRHKAREAGIDFILAVGGGSVIDAAKYIAVAAKLPPDASAWDLIEKRINIDEALQLGVVLTLPASGSEANGNAVISNREKRTKRSLKSEKIYPRFAILDPEATHGLSSRQMAAGLVDAYSHVIEQYLTYPSNSPLQDRFSEGILTTLIALGPELIGGSCNSESMATFMWAATCASNGFASCGAPQDWSSHLIGHEITAEYGVSHADSIGIVLPGVMAFMESQKRAKLAQYGRRVFGLNGEDDESVSRQAVKKTEEFIASMGHPVRLSGVGLGAEAADRISAKIGKYPVKIGEHKNIGREEVRKILMSRA
jgi:NADP-dependent alcohol dehydrogenase